KLGSVTPTWSWGTWATSWRTGSVLTKVTFVPEVTRSGSGTNRQLLRTTSTSPSSTGGSSTWPAVGSMDVKKPTPTTNKTVMTTKARVDITAHPFLPYINIRKDKGIIDVRHQFIPTACNDGDSSRSHRSKYGWEG